MSKLPMANFKTMDRLLRHLGFAAVRQKGSHVFYRHTMDEQRHFPITETGISPVRSCARFYGKFPSHPLSLRNYSKNFSTEENTPRGVFFIPEKIAIADSQTTH